VGPARRRDATELRSARAGRLRAVDVDAAIAVVTGGASGIGRATALELARRGADVVAADIHEERLAIDASLSDAIAGAPVPPRIA
jgi:heterodisulfide reductase subunit A-like polyferredoxin